MRTEWQVGLPATVNAAVDNRSINRPVRPAGIPSGFLRDDSGAFYARQIELSLEWNIANLADTY